MPDDRAAPMEWGTALKARGEGARPRGRGVAQPFPGGLLLAAVSGLGEERAAGRAASYAARTLRRHAEESLIPLVVRCDAALRGGPGASAALARVDAASRRMLWTAIGGIEALLLRAGAGRELERLPQNLGSLGGRLALVRAFAVSLEPGDVLVLASEGAAGGLDGSALRDAPPQRLAELIAGERSCAEGDALALVARWLG